MKRSSLRAFGIACFAIGLLIAFSERITIPFISSIDTKSEEQYLSKISNLEQLLNDANEQISILKKNEQSELSAKEEMSKNTNPNEEANESKDTVSESLTTDQEVTDILYIYSGLTPAEVAQKLKDMKIIKNSVEMELFLAQPEYATTIQKGQFELNSSMTIEEIANTITGKSR